MTDPSSGENRLWTPANIVTLTRILLVPVFVVALLSPWPQWLSFWPEADLWKPWLAAFLFTILACTDALDGYLARSRGEVTNFGKFMDPLADKILVAAALLALVELQMLPSWVALVILVREFIVSGLRMVAASQGIVIAASWYGKAKTVSQIIAILLFIVKGSPLLLDLHHAMGDVLYCVSWFAMIVALVLTVLSMLDYFVKSKDVLGFGSGAKRASDSFFITETTTRGTDETAAISALAASVIAAAVEKGITLSTAESCTGGLIAGSLTGVAGSSQVVEGGVVSYSNEVKNEVLKVSEDDLRRHGAVSSVVAEEMALGSRTLLGTDVAVSVTGVAGPGGGTDEKPVGTVWFGVSSSAGTHSEVRHFEGDRDAVRAQTVVHALELFAITITER